MNTKRIRKTVTAAAVSAAMALGQIPFIEPVISAYSAPVEYDNVLTFTDEGITDETGTGVKISGTDLTINKAGTYKITGSCSEGSIKVKKEVTGVVIVLSDLTLTSSQTAPLSVNKTAGAAVYVEGVCTLTDTEDPANENSEDAEIADAFEGAAIKVKVNAAPT